MRKTQVILSEEAIQKRVAELAEQIGADYKDKKLILIGVLDGACVLIADLLRALWKVGLTDVDVQFLGVSSYGLTTSSSRNPKITKDVSVDLAGRHVLLVEDIADTGHTLSFVFDECKKRNPESVKILALLSKKSRREVEVDLSYVGFEIEDKWVEGYGLDTAGKGRGNPDIIEILEE